jgi:hypothetical protein
MTDGPKGTRKPANSWTKKPIQIPSKVSGKKNNPANSTNRSIRMKDDDKHGHPRKVIIDQKPFDWTEQFITGAQIKQLASVDPSYGVWLELPGNEDDPPIADNQTFDLYDHQGIAKFFTGKKTTTEGFK